MRRVRDRNLPDPFRTWIDRAIPLPPGVTVLPRTIDFWAELIGLLCVEFVCLVMAGIFIGAATDWLRRLPTNTAGLAVLAVGLLLLFGWPIWMVLRLWRTVEASRDEKAGRLRQGVVVGPEGVLVRLVPNRCYAIPMDRFVTARSWGGGGESGVDYLRIETRDGPVDFADLHLSVGAAEVNEAVAGARR